MEYYIDNKEYIEDLLKNKDCAIAGGAAARDFFARMEEKSEISRRNGILIPAEYLFAVFDADEFERFCVRMCMLKDFFSQETHTSKEHLLTSFCNDDYEKIVQGEKFRKNGKLNKFFLDNSEEGNGNLFTSSVYLKDRIRDFAIFDRLINESLSPHAFLWEPMGAEATDAQGTYALAEEIIKMANFYDENKKTLFFLTGLSGVGKTECCKELSKEIQRQLIFVDLKRIVNEKKNCLEEIFFEAQICGSGICYMNFEVLLEDEEQWEAANLLERTLAVTDLAICLSEKKWHPYENDESYGTYALEMTVPDATERIEIWRQLLIDEGIDGQESVIGDVANKFQFTKGRIREAVREAVRRKVADGKQIVDSECIYKGCQSRIPHIRSNNKIIRINKGYKWDDLILPDHSKQLLQTACNRINKGNIVYGDWGFGEKLPYGKGVSMIFAGPPGTGKTMGAQVMAQHLSLEIYRINLAGVVNKYIGETEKNLEKVFDYGIKSQGILFFDEADVLFSKRTEVKDSNDKYSNMEAAFMLQKIEEYEGICILATNYIQNFDEAFKRRIKYIIDFPFPDEEYRFLLWKNVFPKETPVAEDVDFKYLAKHFELSGSNVKNIAINAAFEAASNKRDSIGMQEIIKGLKIEYAKSGKSIVKEDLGPYFLMY